MATYAEYLRANGATEEEIKVLVNPTSERTFAKMEAGVVAANDARLKAEKGVKTLQDWYNDQAMPAYAKMERELVVVKSNEARARTALLSAQSQGLLDIAKDLGYTVEPPVVPAGTPPPFDASKYVTMENLTQVAKQEGEAIALVADIAAEHAMLFGGDPSKARLNFRALRREAESLNVPFEQHWMAKYNVQAARDAREASDKAVYEKRLIDQGRAAATEEFASRYGNPDTRPLVTSISPLAPRPNSGRDKQPWDSGDMSNDRVSRATKRVIEQMAGGGPPRAN